MVEAEVRAHGAIPATIAIVNGRLKAGLSEADIEQLGRSGREVVKVSRRDVPFIVAAGATGATTVASTMIIAAMAGIRVFATGGIGGVHRGAQESFDVSADLQELARTPVAVVCAGAKSILDLRLTLEYSGNARRTRGGLPDLLHCRPFSRAIAHSKWITAWTLPPQLLKYCTPSGVWVWTVAW